MSRTGTIRPVDVLILLVAAVAAAAVVMRNDREVSDVFSRDWVEAVARRWPPSGLRRGLASTPKRFSRR